MYEVVEIEGMPGQYIIYSCVDHENCGSCSYDRDYMLIPINALDGIEYFNPDNMKMIFYKLRGLKNTIKKVEGVAPFKLTKETRVYVDRAKPKQITVFE
jgi:hypothetical protein